MSDQTSMTPSEDAARNRRSSRSDGSGRFPYDQGYVEASVQLPRMGKLLRYRVTLADDVARCFARLPRCREVPFQPEEGRRAVEQQAQRRELARMLAEMLTDSILKAVESDDTINGYEPDEWKRMYSPNEKLTHGPNNPKL